MDFAEGRTGALELSSSSLQRRLHHAHAKAEEKWNFVRHQFFFSVNPRQFPLSLAVTSPASPDDPHDSVQRKQLANDALFN